MNEQWGSKCASAKNGGTWGVLVTGQTDSSGNYAMNDLRELSAQNGAELRWLGHDSSERALCSEW